ncbi:MAG TPA: carbohydrate kinase family protein [Actinobacteria bacterium]|nr:carbohydrate kinase family protein [Actinomycetota bacterium]
MKLVVTGSIAFDYLMHFPGRFADALKKEKLDAISVSFLVQEMTKHRGGTAANIAYSNGLMGGQPKLMATAGKDFSDYRDVLEDAGVDTSAVIVIEDEYTSSFFANTDRDENQIASFYAGAMGHADKLSFGTHAPGAELAIISPNDPGAMKQYVEEARRRELPYIFDPSQQTLWLSGEDLAEAIDGCYLLAVNEYELHLVKDKTGLSEDDLLKRCTKGLIVTKGNQGSTLMIDGDVIEIPIVPPHQVLDPTGAGDAFRAGIMRGLQLQLPWELAGRVAALSATYCIENNGPQNHLFDPPAFVARFRRHFDDDGALDGLEAS